MHVHQVLFRHRRKQVQVAFDAAGFRHQRKRVVRLVHQLDHSARQAQFPLYRLVAIGGRADGDKARFVVLLGKFRAQHGRDIALGDDLGFEVEPG